MSAYISKKAFPDGHAVHVDRIFETSRKEKPRLVTRTAWVSAEVGVKPNPAHVYTRDRVGKLRPEGGNVNCSIGKAGEERVSRAMENRRPK